ncbi:M56 family metallopeptidase [Enterococcus cecorum]|uniref:M56 family metallopeptidase n=1 Tax=Enterococcus cecorum TaxID=44008 RepID=UPI003F201DAA
MRIYHLLLVIWGTGFMIKICSYVNNIYKLKKIIHCSENVIDDYKKIFPYLNKSSVTGVYYFQNITQPTTFFLKKSVIFLPPIQYEIQELNYIFLHELMHIKNKDILIKYLLLLLSALYWWLPLIHRFQKDITLLLELRVDSQICHDLSEKEKNDYIKSLVLVAQKINKHNNVKFHPLGTSFIIREQNTLTKRINFYLDDVTERKKAIIVITFSFFITLSFPSIVIEPYHQPQEIENTWSESKFIKQHFIQANIDGSYSLIEKGSNIEISKITNINIEPFNKMKIFPEDKKK